MTSESKVKAALREKIKLSTNHRRTFYLLVFSIWITGVVWLIFDAYIRVPTSFGSAKHPGQTIVLWVHGIVAYLLLIVLGSLFIHIKRGLALKINLASGFFLIGLFSLIIITGVGLYYLSDEGLRLIASRMHWILGMPLPLIIAGHILNGKILRKREKNNILRKA